MAVNQSPEAAASAIDRIASSRMGVEPAAPAPSAPSDPAASQPPADAKQQKDTDQDKAAEQGSPETEGDKSRNDAVLYEVEIGEGKKRQYTPQQIRSMAERYSALNFKNQQLKPVIEVVENLLKSQDGMTPSALADNLKNMLNAEGPSTFGADSKTNGDKAADDKSSPPPRPTSNEDLAAQLKAWEEENAASLPPGYKEMLMAGNSSQQTVAQMAQQLQAMQQMLGQVLGSAKGTAEAARAGVEAADRNQTQAMVRTIQNNLDRLQASLGLPDEAAEDFMMFAAERGYTFEDFIDPDLLGRVMQDFKINMEAPEMERIREVHRRRQAYTGSLGSAPQSGAAAPASQGDATLDRLTNVAMGRRLPS